MPRFDLSQYETVEERIKRLLEEHPDARIVTKLIDDFRIDGPRTWTFKASVFLTAGDQAAGLPKATGYASETEGTGGANNGSACENGETSSIGRCLKNMSMSGVKGASRQEMEKVNRIESTDWIAEANASTNVTALRSLYTRARAQGAPAKILETVKARAEALGQQDSRA